MSRYRRAAVPGAAYFFTLATYRRQPLLTKTEVLAALRSAHRMVRTTRPFRVEAMVVLPDHLHAVWEYYTSHTQRPGRGVLSALPGRSPSERIRDLVCGYPSSLLSQKLLVMFEAYVDDSGSDLGDKQFFLCAYVNSASEWAKFSDDWQGALDAHPKIDYFHMVVAWGLRDQFRGWSVPDRNKKLETLGRVIESYKPVSLSVSLSKKVFEDILKPVAPYHLTNPYLACFYGIVIGVGRLHKQLGVSLPVDYIFDETTASKETVLWYDYVKSQHPHLAPLLGSSPVFKDDKAIMPLQAADMLAWHVRRKSEGRTEFLPALRYLRSIYAEMQMSEQTIRELAAKMAAVPGVSRMSSKRDWKRIRPLMLRQLTTGTWPGGPRDGNFLQRALKRLAAFIGAKFSRSRNKSR